MRRGGAAFRLIQCVVSTKSTYVGDAASFRNEGTCTTWHHHSAQSEASKVLCCSLARGGTTSSCRDKFANHSKATGPDCWQRIVIIFNALCSRDGPKHDEKRQACSADKGQAPMRSSNPQKCCVPHQWPARISAVSLSLAPVISTARPNPPSGRSWRCFGNRPRRPVRYCVLEIA